MQPHTFSIDMILIYPQNSDSFIDTQHDHKMKWDKNEQTINNKQQTSELKREMFTDSDK